MGVGNVAFVGILSHLSLRGKDQIPFSLDTVLCHLNGVEQWTVRDAFEGLHVFGGTGSGKTSGSGRHFALALLRAGFGGLVLTVKPDEGEFWKALANEAGRADDLQFIRIEGRGKVENPLNFLECEQASAGSEGQAANLASLFLAASRAMESADSAPDQSYWTDSLRQLLRSAITLLDLAGERLTVPNISEVINSAAVDRKQVKSVAWSRSSYCSTLLREAAQRTPNDSFAHYDFLRVLTYFTIQLPGLPQNTRASVVSTFTTKADILLDSTIRALLCGETSPMVTPERTHQGAIVVVDLPVLRWNEVGRFAQLLIKTVWQRATQRRDADGGPVFLWADESQHFVTEEDYKFLQTARSARAATVYLTQGVSNYHAMMAGRNSRASTNALLGGFQTKVFHANGDGETNRWAEELFGHEIRVHKNPTYSLGSLRIDRHPMRQPVMPSKAFTELKKGGRYGYTEAYVFQAGREWRSTHGNCLKAVFNQAQRGR